jgi:hypothetical protein
MKRRGWKDSGGLDRGSGMAANLRSINTLMLDSYDDPAFDEDLS